jgi:hypothetical protein
MTSYAVENPKGRRRLLRHCALVGRAVKRRIPARRRLERALGREQARMLVHALPGDQGLARRGRRLRRRVKSSP